jgi:PBSX family phage terminase large subunit
MNVVKNKKNFVAFYVVLLFCCSLLNAFNNWSPKETIRMELSAKQKYSLAYSDARLNIWDGAVSSGKTIASIFRWVDFIDSGPKGDLLMIGVTVGTLYRNVITPMLEFLGGDMVYMSSVHRIKLWGRTIHCVGASDKNAERLIRGMTIAGCYIDEITLCNVSAFKMALSRMRVKGAKLFGTTNPDSPHHWFKKEYMDDPDLHLKLFHFKLEDNTWLVENNPEYIEEIKKEYAGLWYDRFILGLWKAAEGVIFDFFLDQFPFVINHLPKANRHFVSIDYGTQNPCVFTLFGVKDFPLNGEPKVWTIKEYYYCGKTERKQKTSSEYSKDLKKFLGKIKPEKIFVDPSEAQFIAQLRKDGFYGVEGADNSVGPGLKRHMEWLSSGLFRVGYSCVKLREEYSLYLWDPKAQEKGKDEPLKQDDHCQDTVRYGLLSYFPLETETINYSAMLE